jgi:hypothetical protein
MRTSRIERRCRAESLIPPEHTGSFSYRDGAGKEVVGREERVKKT